MQNPFTFRSRKREQARAVLATRLIETASAHIGYRSEPLKNSIFGLRAGYGGFSWDGTFIDAAIRDAGLDFDGLPSHINPASALQYYIRNGDTVHGIFRRALTAQPGDIVFFPFTTDTASGFGPLHVGLVVDGPDSAGSIRVLEGQTNTGLPRGPQEQDGVYIRTRYATEILTVARPKYGEPVEKPELPTLEQGFPVLHTRDFQPNKRSNAVEILQMALAEATGEQEFRRGVFDSQTRAAYAYYQRTKGFNGQRANGLPDAVTLTALGLETRRFTVET